MLAPIRPRPIIPSCMRPAWHVACGRGPAPGARRLGAPPGCRRRRVAPRAATRCSTRARRGRLDSSPRPSLLPDWTVGHVLTHLARNADSMDRVLEAAERGDVVERYAGGGAGRDAEIEAGRRARPPSWSPMSADDRAPGAAVGRGRAGGTAAAGRSAREIPVGRPCRSGGGGRSRCITPTSGWVRADRTGRGVRARELVDDGDALERPPPDGADRAPGARRWPPPRSAWPGCSAGRRSTASRRRAALELPTVSCCVDR